MNRAALVLLCLAACKHGGGSVVELDVRNRNTATRSRSFDWDAGEGKLEAFTPQGRLLSLWLHPSRLQVTGTSDVTVPRGCHGGYIEQRGASATNLIEVIACPAKAPAEGWTGWHADLYVYGDAAVLGSIPPKVDFAVRADPAGAAVEVAAKNFRGKLAIPPGVQGDLVRAYPEMMAFALVTGVVPAASDGQYELVPR